MYIELWKWIAGYEGLYMVSTHGRVKSMNYRGNGKPKLLKQYILKNGYKQVTLYKDSKQTKYLVHRLVAQAFLDNPNNLPYINHKDENPNNNAVWNLEWCTCEYNINYGTCRERISKSLKGKTAWNKGKTGCNKGKNHPKAKAILMYSLEGEFIRRFDCVAEANEYLGKNRYSSNIFNCLAGNATTAWGYKWKYEEDCK